MHGESSSMKSILCTVQKTEVDVSLSTYHMGISQVPYLN